MLDQDSNSNQWNHHHKCNNNEAEDFKENLKIENVFKRSQNCSNYFETLAALIYNLPPGQMIDIKKYTNPDAKSYVKNNSMAVSYVVHNNPGIFEILFHIMFRPYNNYCIIIDAKSPIKLKTTFQSIIKCYKETFPRTNIIIANWTLPIYYFNITGYSSLNADLTCLELMYKSSRYVIIQFSYLFKVFPVGWALFSGLAPGLPSPAKRNRRKTLNI